VEQFPVDLRVIWITYSHPRTTKVSKDLLLS
jgi:hypothetical protein